MHTHVLIVLLTKYVFVVALWVAVKLNSLQRTSDSIKSKTKERN